TRRRRTPGPRLVQEARSTGSGRIRHARASHRRRHAHLDLAPGARQGCQRPGLPGGRGLVDPEVMTALHSENRSMTVHEKPSPSWRPEALSLPARYYIDPANHQSELERFFLSMWIHAGRADQLPASGDYLLRDVAGESLIVTRADDGIIHAFYNVCR